MSADMERLVLAAIDGDSESYGQLVGQTSPLVASIAFAIVQDLELSRDIAQDVFLSAWRSLRNIRNPDSFLPWLRQVTRNRSRMALRSQLRYRRFTVCGVEDGSTALAADPRPAAIETLVAEEERRALHQALSCLPLETREIVTLFYREGQSVSQVASLLDMTEAAVRKRLSRARETLRGSIEIQVSETLCRTSPGPAFTAVVLSSLPSSALSRIAATVPILSKLWGRALLAKTLSRLTGIALGAVGATLGVLHTARAWLRDAQDDRERRALRQHRTVSVVAMCLFAISLPAVLIFTVNPWLAIPWFACLIVVVAVLEHVWRPRIVRRRFEGETQRDAGWAADRRRRERRSAILGWVLGLIGGSVGLVAGLWLALRAGR